MSAINLNNSSEYIKEIKVFNEGKAGVVEPVKVRIEKKASNTGPDDKTPDYKVIISNDSGEINEGFYYQEPGSDAFNKFQAQRLINLAQGVLGKNVTFPEFNTPREALDGVMAMVAKGLNKYFRIAVCYGTTKKPSRFLTFKSFGSFIQPIDEPKTLTLTKMDSLVRSEEQPTPASQLIKESDDLFGEPTTNDKDLAWLND